MNLIKFSVLILTFLFLTVSVNATPKNAEKTGKQCDYCHPEGPPNLGPAGLYFKEHNTLEGYGVIGVHMPQWDVALVCFGTILSIGAIAYIFRI